MATNGIPPGWTDLALVLVQLEPAAVPMDCVVAGVRTLTTEEGDEPVRGHPLALRINAPERSTARQELETWLQADPSVALLTDAEGSVLLLTLDERMIALELERGA